MGIFGPPNIEKLKAKKNVKGLIKALNYKKDPYMREAAASALGEIGDNRAVEPLIDAFRFNLRFGRNEAAAAALGEIRDARAVEPLIAALKGGCSVAEEALSKIGGPAIDSLVDILQDKSLEAREAAARALGEIGEQAIGSLVTVLKNKYTNKHWELRVAVVNALGEIGSPAVELLIDALKDKVRPVREAAARALSKIGDTRATKPLCDALNDNHHSVRMIATTALGKIGDAQAIKPLIASFKRWHDVREDVIKALIDIGETAIDPLISALKDRNQELREVAAVILKKLGWEPDRGEAGAWYWVAKRDWKKAIAIGSPAVEPLIAALKNRDTRKFAADALQKLGWEPDRGEDGAWYWITKREWGKTSAIGLPAIKPLITVLKDRDCGLGRETVARTLGDIGEQAIGPLIDILRDNVLRDNKLCIWAIFVLDRLGWKPDDGEAGAWYWVSKRDWDKAIALGTPAVEPLISIINKHISLSRNVRQEAARALVRMYREGALDEQSKKRILAVRRIIEEPHRDTVIDQAPFGYVHSDNNAIGVDFPL